MVDKREENWPDFETAKGARSGPRSSKHYGTTFAQSVHSAHRLRPKHFSVLGKTREMKSEVKGVVAMEGQSPPAGQRTLALRYCPAR